MMAHQRRLLLQQHRDQLFNELLMRLPDAQKAQLRASARAAFQEVPPKMRKEHFAYQVR